MDDSTNLLIRLDVIIKEYNDLGEKLVFEDLEMLIFQMKELSSTLYFLEAHRDQASRDYNNCLYVEVEKGTSVNKAEIIASKFHPKLYELRRKMTSAYKVLDAIRSTISYLKREQ